MAEQTDADKAAAAKVDADKAALAKSKCPDCGRSLEVYDGANEFKVGTGFCSNDGKRYQLSKA